MPVGQSSLNEGARSFAPRTTVPDGVDADWKAGLGFSFFVQTFSPDSYLQATGVCASCGVTP